MKTSDSQRGYRGIWKLLRDKYKIIVRRYINIIHAGYDNSVTVTTATVYARHYEL